MVSLSQDAIEQIRDSLNSVSDTINESIEEQIKDTEDTQEKKDEVKEKNVVEKDKATLSSNEKKRFGNIAKIFIDQWVKSILQLQKAQEKRNALVIKKPKKNNLLGKLKDFLSKIHKKEEVKECKTGMSWWAKLLLILGSLGLIYVLFKDSIDKFLPMAEEMLAAVGSWVWDMFGKGLGIAWNLLGKLCGMLWDWIKEKLHLEEIGQWLAGLWTSFTDWIKKLWDNIKSGFKSFIDTIIGLPGKLLSWLGDMFMALLNPILDAIKSAWDWIVDKVVAFWEWIKGIFTGFWDNISSIWDNITGFFSGIWDWFTSSWEKILDFVSGLFSWEKIKNLIMGALDGALNIAGKVGDMVSKGWDTVVGWFSSDDDEEAEKKRREEERKQEIEKQKKEELKKKELDAKKALEKQKEIVLKDNILETIKDICARLNVFFSDKKDGFIDLSGKVLEEFKENFKDISKYIQKLEFKYDFKIDDEDTYKDSYDYSDRSQRVINNKNHISNDHDYRITYNIVDVPAVKRALQTIQDGQKEEILLLASQNDYLTKMVSSMDGLGTKLSWLDPDKLKEQTTNTVIPIIQKSLPPNEGSYNAAAMKGVQASMADALR